MNIPTKDEQLLWWTRYTFTKTAVAVATQRVGMELSEQPAP